jgi:hypothetical protein
MDSGGGGGLPLSGTEMAVAGHSPPVPQEVPMRLAAIR